MRQQHLRGRGPHIPPLDSVVQFEFEPGYVLFPVAVQKRLRVEAGGAVIADTVRGVLLYELDHLPVYYFPIEDIRTDLMAESGQVARDPFKGTATYYSLQTPAGRIENLMWRYDGSVAGCPDLSGYASFDWPKADRWLEEDEEIFVHPRDPFRRVDILPSSRHVQIYLGGGMVAETRRAHLLFETGLPTRYYLPIEDVLPGILQPSGTVSRCPYKGLTNYYNVMLEGRLYPDLVWYYPEPVYEAGRIRGLVSFANELVDKIVVDGQEQPRPVTALSVSAGMGGSDRQPASASPVTPTAELVADL